MVCADLIRPVDMTRRQLLRPVPVPFPVLRCVMRKPLSNVYLLTVPADRRTPMHLVRTDTRRRLGGKSWRRAADDTRRKRRTRRRTAVAPPPPSSNPQCFSVAEVTFRNGVPISERFSRLAASSLNLWKCRTGLKRERVCRPYLSPW